MKSEFKTFFETVAAPALQKANNYSNRFAVGKIVKVILSIGINKSRNLKQNVDNLTAIAGQKAVIVKAKKSIAQFGIRTGFDNGVKVTLRNNNMYNFLYKLLNVALVSWKNFPGFFKRSINVRGEHASYSLGIKDYRIFSELSQISAMKDEGLNITIVTTCRTTEDLQQLLETMGFPFGDKK